MITHTCIYLTQFDWTCTNSIVTLLSVVKGEITKFDNRPQGEAVSVHTYLPLLNIR